MPVLYFILGGVVLLAVLLLGIYLGSKTQPTPIIHIHEALPAQITVRAGDGTAYSGYTKKGEQVCRTF